MNIGEIINEILIISIKDDIRRTDFDMQKGKYLISVSISEIEETDVELNESEEILH